MPRLCFSDEYDVFDGEGNKWRDSLHFYDDGTLMETRIPACANLAVKIITTTWSWNQKDNKVEAKMAPGLYQSKKVWDEKFESYLNTIMMR